MIKKVAQVSLGLFLALAGISHLGSNREEFRAQVPTWLPFDADFVVLASGIIEIILGLLLIALWKFRSIIGWVVALFFIIPIESV